MVVSTETVAVLIILCGSRPMKSTPQIRDADETNGQRMHVQSTDSIHIREVGVAW
jgi:hypothetical protein